MKTAMDCLQELSSGISPEHMEIIAKITDLLRNSLLEEEEPTFHRTLGVILGTYAHMVLYNLAIVERQKEEEESRDFLIPFDNLQHFKKGIRAINRYLLDAIENTQIIISKQKEDLTLLNKSI